MVGLMEALLMVVPAARPALCVQQLCCASPPIPASHEPTTAACRHWSHDPTNAAKFPLFISVDGDDQRTLLLASAMAQASGAQVITRR